MQILITYMKYLTYLLMRFLHLLYYFYTKNNQDAEVIDIKFKTTSTITILTFKSLVLALKIFNTTSNSDICKNIEIILVFFIYN